MQIAHTYFYMICSKSFSSSLSCVFVVVVVMCRAQLTCGYRRRMRNAFHLLRGIQGHTMYDMNGSASGFTVIYTLHIRISCCTHCVHASLLVHSVCTVWIIHTLDSIRIQKPEQQQKKKKKNEIETDALFSLYTTKHVINTQNYNPPHALNINIHTEMGKIHMLLICCLCWWIE